MVEFDVTLTQFDLKKFIIHKLKIRNFKFWMPVVFCFLLATLTAVINVYFGFGFFAWFTVLILLFIGFLPVYRALKIFKSMLESGAYLIDKCRKFYIDERSVYILCEDSSTFFGRYFFYDLIKFEQIASHLFFTFNDKIYIIIPKRCLKQEQLEALILILKKIKE